MSERRWHIPAHDAVRDRTGVHTNRRIDQGTNQAIDDVFDSPAMIQARLSALDREWNIDRALMLNFAALGTLTSLLAMRSLRRHGKLGGWGALFFTQLSFLAYHAIRRWCPPMPVFRRLGFRSDREICAERVALEQRLAALKMTGP
jgi:hypothetical protein